MLRFSLSLFVSLFVCFPVSANAEPSETSWVEHGGMLSSRIVAASQELSPGGGVMLAWEAKLAPGWKTYWRSPGEAGLPVRVFIEDKELDPFYPLPERFELFGIQTFGYSHQLLLPFEIEKPSVGPLKIRVDFMVCKDICVPFRQDYQLDVGKADAKTSNHDIRFETWLSKVPAQGTGAMYGLEILGARVAGKVGHQKLIVEVRGKTDLLSADLLAEVNDMFHFGIPKIRLLEDGKAARMVLSAMTGAKPEDLRGQRVRLTFTDGRGAAIDRMIELPK